MPKLSIDHRQVEVPPGATVLDAARKLGIDLPALCFRDGCEASTSCLVCMVKIAGHDRFAPACATAAAEGMEVESETQEVHQLRRNALELLLSDHLGDCLAPCWFACPARMDIPQMLRQIAAGQLRQAIATVKRDIALPAVLGRICPAPCERACRRSGLDGAVAICLLRRYVADVDMASGDPYMPPCRPPTGRRVAIVGAGPTGLAAAHYLAQQGHAATIFDEGRQAGRTAAAGEPGAIALGGARRRDCAGARAWRRIAARHADRPRRGRLRTCGRSSNAVLLACGAHAGTHTGDCPDFRVAKMGLSPSAAPANTLATTPLGILIDKDTFATSLAGVFAAGNAVHGRGLVVRSVADGKEAAAAIGRFLAAGSVAVPSAFSTKIGRMEHGELVQLAAGSSPEPRLDRPTGGYTAAEAAAQAARCMHCDCRGLHSCKLRHYAALYGAHPRRYKAPRRPFQQDASHPEVIFEPGKCIDCGLCIQIAAAAGETLGLSFVGRGFDVRVAVPLGGFLGEALRKAAADCIAACPTAALAWKTDAPPPPVDG